MKIPSSSLCALAVVVSFVLGVIRFPSGAHAAADSVVVFNEIHYHPADELNDTEWVELRNLNGVDVDISNWRLRGGVDFDFVEGTLISGHGFLIVAADPAHASLAGRGALGPFTGRLANNGEELRIENQNKRGDGPRVVRGRRGLAGGARRIGLDAGEAGSGIGGLATGELDDEPRAGRHAGRVEFSDCGAGAGDLRFDPTGLGLEVRRQRHGAGGRLEHAGFQRQCLGLGAWGVVLGDGAELGRCGVDWLLAAG